MPVGAAIKLCCLDWHIGFRQAAVRVLFVRTAMPGKKESATGGMALSGMKNSVDGGIHMSL
jgi:hypothetical protein